MTDRGKTKAELVRELEHARKKIRELEFQLDIWSEAINQLADHPEASVLEYWEWDLETDLVTLTPPRQGLEPLFTRYDPKISGGRTHKWSDIIHPDDVVSAREDLARFSAHDEDDEMMKGAKIRLLTRAKTWEWVVPVDVYQNPEQKTKVQGTFRRADTAKDFWKRISQEAASLAQGDSGDRDRGMAVEEAAFQLKRAIELTMFREYAPGISIKSAVLAIEHLLFSTHNIPVFIKDKEFRYVFVNEGMIRAMGLTRSEMLGRTDKDLGQAPDAERFDQVSLFDYDSPVLFTRKRLVGQYSLSFFERSIPIRLQGSKLAGILGIADGPPEKEFVVDVLDGAENEWRSPAMRECLRQAQTAANFDTPVLLTGETGSGKDWLAEWIHSRSRRSDRPFFTVNCAAIPSELAESELFGHTASAFSGARGPKKGLLELAEDGTLLLNEVGELPLTIQAKLLTFLDTMTFTPLGGQKPISVKARIIAATKRNLEEQVSQGHFRDDLFFRLNRLRIKVPPLRARIKDLPLFVNALLPVIFANLGLNATPQVAPDAMDRLSSYSWPGNLRDLYNVLEQAAMRATGGTITSSMLGLPPQERPAEDIDYYPLDQPTPTIPATTEEDVKLAVASFHRLAPEEQGRHLKKILVDVCGGESGAKSYVAEIIGVDKRTIENRLRLVGGVELKTGNPRSKARERLVPKTNQYLIDHFSE